jgi:DNA-binding CsgD family transcriptional regulator
MNAKPCLVSDRSASIPATERLTARPAPLRRAVVVTKDVERSLGELDTLKGLSNDQVELVRHAAHAVARTACEEGQPKICRLQASQSVELDILALPAVADVPALVVLIFYPPAQILDLLVRRYSFTASEAEVTLALTSGLSPAEIALTRGVRLSTVRSQIAAALAKTGVTSQARLIVLVARLRAGEL